MGTYGVAKRSSTMNKRLARMSRRPVTLKLFAVASAMGAAAALDNGFDRPPMGWSALYGAPFGTVNETMVLEAAAGLNASGLLAAGYEYVTLDDWYATRDAATGRMIAKPDTFPSGMPAVSAGVHERGERCARYETLGARDACAERRW